MSDSIKRLFKIKQIIDQSDRPLKPSEIAELTGLSVRTIQRMVKYLVDERLIVIKHCLPKGYMYEKL